MIWRALQDVLPLINAAYQTALMLPEQASAMARQIDTLHYVEITVFLLVAIGFMGATIWCLVRYRRRDEPHLTPAIHAPELLVVYSGVILALFLAFWFFSFRQYAVIAAAPDDAMPVYVTAKQWMWKFEYPEGINSAGVFYVPVGRTVRVLLTSRDVIHSFYVPALRIKQDVIPGTYTSLWFAADRAGTYPLFCAELCGVGHSSMHARLVVLPPHEFDAWLAREIAVVSQPPGVPSAGVMDLAALGSRYAAQHGCFNCHTTDGRAHIGPTWAGLYGREERLQDGATLVVDPAYITKSMMDPAAQIVAGFSPVMPSFRGEIEPAETAAIVEFIKSLRARPRRAGSVLP